MRRLASVAGLALALLFSPHASHAGVLVHIDKSRQLMTVLLDGEVLNSFVVSTGRAGYGTPNGVYRPQRLARRWFSKKYYHSPMPHSIFFHGGFAIHGSYEISRLGGPASHGCVRLHPTDAASLYALVQLHGPGHTKIVVTGTNPPAGAPARPRWFDQDPPSPFYPPYPAYRPGYVYDW